MLAKIFLYVVLTALFFGVMAQQQEITVLQKHLEICGVKIQDLDYQIEVLMELQRQMK